MYSISLSTNRRTYQTQRVTNLGQNVYTIITVLLLSLFCY